MRQRSSETSVLDASMAKKKVTKKVATSPKTGAVDQKARKALLKAVREDGFALRNADKSLKGPGLFA